MTAAWYGPQGGCFVPAVTELLEPVQARMPLGPHPLHVLSDPSSSDSTPWAKSKEHRRLLQITASSVVETYGFQSVPVGTRVTWRSPVCPHFLLFCV